MTGMEVAMLATMIAGGVQSGVQANKQHRIAKKSAKTQSDAMDRSRRAALKTERENAENMRVANRRRPNPVAGMASNRGVGRTSMTGPMGLGGATTLGGGTA
jgi:hypothetical protein